MEPAVEWFVAITALVAGASHVLRPNDWAAAFLRLHQLGRPAAFMNGILSLIPGAVILAGHRTWVFPGVVITGYGCLLLLKAAVCLLAPDAALRSMQRGAKSPRSFVAAGIVAMALSAWSFYCLSIRK
jgi:hypothetical protein